MAALALTLAACGGEPDESGSSGTSTSTAATVPSTDGQALITHLPLSGDEFGTQRERRVVQKLEDRLSRAVHAIGGEHDGDEFGGGEAVLYTYGPDADELLVALRNSLKSYRLKPGAYAIKRYGRADDPAAREVRVPLP